MTCSNLQVQQFHRPGYRDTVTYADPYMKPDAAGYRPTVLTAAPSSYYHDLPHRHVYKPDHNTNHVPVHEPTHHKQLYREYEVTQYLEPAAGASGSPYSLTGGGYKVSKTPLAKQPEAESQSPAQALGLSALYEPPYDQQQMKATYQDYSSANANPKPHRATEAVYVSQSQPPQQQEAPTRYYAYHAGGERDQGAGTYATVLQEPQSSLYYAPPSSLTAGPPIYYTSSKAASSALPELTASAVYYPPNSLSHQQPPLSYLPLSHQQSALRYPNYGYGVYAHY